MPESVNPDTAEKDLKAIKNASTSAVALGWLQIIGTTGVFLWRLFDAGFDSYGLPLIGLTDVIATAGLGTLFVIFGKRAQNLEDKGLEKSFLVLLLVAITELVLFIAAGASPGILLLLLIYYLFNGYRKSKSLHQNPEYASKVKPAEHSIKGWHWIVIGIVFVFAILIGVGFDEGFNQVRNSTSAVDSYEPTTNTQSGSPSVTPFFSTEGNFQVEFPSYPETASDSFLVQGFSVPYTQYSQTDSEGREYLVQVAKYPAAALEGQTEKETLEGTVNGMIGATPGSSLVNSSFSTFQGNIAVDATIFDGSNTYIKVKNFLVGNTLYTIAVTDSTQQNGSFSSFIATFKLTN